MIKILTFSQFNFFFEIWVEISFRIFHLMWPSGASFSNPIFSK